MNSNNKSTHDAYPWFAVCMYCRERIVACCEFYSFVRQVRLGLHNKRTVRELFLEVCLLKRKMFLRRFGGPSPWMFAEASTGSDGNVGLLTTRESLGGSMGPSALTTRNSGAGARPDRDVSNNPRLMEVGKTISFESLSSVDDILERVKKLPPGQLRERLLGGVKVGEVSSLSLTAGDGDDLSDVGDVEDVGEGRNGGISKKGTSGRNAHPEGDTRDDDAADDGDKDGTQEITAMPRRSSSADSALSQLAGKLRRSFGY
jgi:hypothetical protein